MSSRESSDFKKLVETLNKVCHQFQFEIYEYSQIRKIEDLNVHKFWSDFMKEYQYPGFLGDHLSTQRYGNITITTNFNEITFCSLVRIINSHKFTKVTTKNII